MCMLGKEEIRKHALIHKADKQARRTLQKGYNRLEKKFNECRSMLYDKTNKVVVLTQRLKSREREDAEAFRSSESESPEVVKEVVETAGDYKYMNAVGSK